MPAYGLFSRVAEEPFGRMIPRLDDSLQRLADDGVMRGLDQGCQALLAFALRYLGLPALGDLLSNQCFGLLSLDHDRGLVRTDIKKQTLRFRRKIRALRARGHDAKMPGLAERGDGNAQAALAAGVWNGCRPTSDVRIHPGA